MRDLVEWITALMPDLWWALLAALAVSVGLFLARALTRPVPLALRDAVRDLLLLGALALIVVATLTPVAGVDAADGWQLRPFRDLLQARSRWATQLALANILANAALFVPLGVALAARFSRTPGLVLLAVAGLVSLAVEVLQRSTTGRTSDVTDVIMNAAGAGIGVVLARGIARGTIAERR